MKISVFGPFLNHFLNFWDKKKFPENSDLSRTTSSTMQKTLLINYTIAWRDGRIQGGKDGEALFYMTLQTTTGGPKDFEKQF